MSTSRKCHAQMRQRKRGIWRAFGNCPVCPIRAMSRRFRGNVIADSQPPSRVLVNKPCIDPDVTLPVLLDYFDRHTPEELLGQTLAINVDLIALLWGKTRVPVEITFGWVEIKGQHFGECSLPPGLRLQDTRLRIHYYNYEHEVPLNLPK
jgi:hypothetical protein